jgi:hypothetical protein
VTAGRIRAATTSLLATLVLTTLALIPGVVAPDTVVAAEPGLTVVTDATYTVRPEEGDVQVAVAMTARNRTSETRTRRFFFDHTFLAVQPGATNLRISGPKGARVRAVRRTEDSTLLRVDFGSRLYSGKSATLELSFDLPGKGSDASPQVRVGSGLVTLPVWAFASTGTRGSSVTVRFPPGWDVAVESGELPRRGTGSDGGTVLEAGPLAAPLDFFAFVSAQRPAVYVDRALTVPVDGGDVELLLQGWEDDPAWTSRTGSLLTKGLPALRRDIGLPWPKAEPLVIHETSAREAGAAAGLYDPTRNRMDVAYWADPGVVIHQAAHGWFNGDLLADRWANEGFATFYALRAADELGVSADSPTMTDEAKAAAFPLNAWAASDGKATTAADAYGYAASLALARALAERVGPDVLTAVWSDAAAGTGAYQPPPLDTDTGAVVTPGTDGAGAGTTPEGVEGAPDWRALLDLLEARSGQDLVPLWREWVVRPEESALLDARASARASYGRTLALADGWQLPRAIRDALRSWRFGTAEKLMADARAVLAQRKAVAEMAERDGVALTTTMQSLFEGGAMAEASALAAAQRAAMQAIEDAEASRSVDDDILSQIGMLGEHPEQSLRQAELLLAQDDFEGSAEASDRALRAWTIAWEEGRRRTLMALAGIATLVVLAAAIIGAIRRSRHAAGPDGPSATAAPTGVAPAAPTGVASHGDGGPTA